MERLVIWGAFHPRPNRASNASANFWRSSPGRWLIPAAVRRPPPVGKVRQNASAETDESRGTRTDTRYPPSVLGETIATASPAYDLARSLASVPLARRAQAASGRVKKTAPLARREGARP